MANNNRQSTYYNVKNRSASKVVYRIPEANIRREFAPGESKRLSFKELEQLTYQAGGRELLENFLQVTEEKGIQKLNLHTEAEYYMSEAQVIELMKTGSYEAFLDCLDFAPIGVIDLIKKFAVEMPLTDTRKIEAIKEKTGYDVIKAIEILKEANAPEDAPAKSGETAPAAQPSAPSGRRTTANYRVVTQKTAEE